MTGTRRAFGIFVIFARSGIANMPKIKKTNWANTIPRNTVSTITPPDLKKFRPGRNPWSVIAARKIAAVAPPGIPNAKAGINSPETHAFEEPPAER